MFYTKSRPQLMDSSNLPDILNSHLPPPPPPPHSSSHHHHHHHNHHHVNHHHPYLRSGCSRDSDAETSTTKSCLACSGLSIRWFILSISFIGLVCTVIGTFLGAARPTGKEHLTLALLMIGVGVVLIIVSGIAWRLTSNGPTWRALFGFGEIPSTVGLPGSTLESTARRFLPRVPDPHGRSGAHHHPYGAMFYPEFQYRPPPPSYQASMQEYRLRLLLLERSSSQTQPTSLSPVSPPPTYRSSAASSLAGTLNRPGCNTIQRPISRPPSYRSIIDHNSVNNNNSSNNYSNNNSNGHPIYSSPRLTTTSSTNTSQQALGITSTGGTGTTPTSNYKDDVNRITIHQTNTTSTVCTPHGVNIVAIPPLTVENDTAVNHISTISNPSNGLTILSNLSSSSQSSSTTNSSSTQTTTSSTSQSSSTTTTPLSSGTVASTIINAAAAATVTGVTSNSDNLLTSAFTNGPNPSISTTGNSEIQILAHV
ncbi:uncharacterized protein DDB_G0271670 [Tetranychus urticae]|uniref:Uncharacterized protein n=1 Tax=Tetranychus urticae TaxID=32264 RepID=T1JYB7_TETUR|nr:uncharacterized protein DDB_G0271670 [Tetranychus urticae]